MPVLLQFVVLENMDDGVSEPAWIGSLKAGGNLAPGAPQACECHFARQALFQFEHADRLWWCIGDRCSTSPACDSVKSGGGCFFAIIGAGFAGAIATESQLIVTKVDAAGEQGRTVIRSTGCRDRDPH